MVDRASFEFLKAWRICLLAAVPPQGKLDGVATVCWGPSDNFMCLALEDGFESMIVIHYDVELLTS